MVLSIQLPFAHKQEGIPQTDSLKETPNNHLPQKGDALNPLVKVIAVSSQALALPVSACCQCEQQRAETQCPIWWKMDLMRKGAHWMYAFQGKPKGDPPILGGA